MKLSTSLNLIFEPRTQPLDRVAERIIAAGFEALDFNFTDWLFEGSPLLEPTWRAWVASILKICRAGGVGFSQLHAQIPAFDFMADDGRGREYRRRAEQSLEAAAELGVPWVTFHAQGWPSCAAAEARQRNIEWFSPLVGRAEALGLGIVLENLMDIRSGTGKREHYYCSTPDELIDLVDGFGSTAVGICWDTGHANVQHLDQAGWLRRIGGRLKATHIQDNDGISDGHTIPFYGTIDWEPVVSALREIDYGGDFTYEAHNFTRPLPDSLRDEAMRLMVAVGKHLLRGRG